VPSVNRHSARLAVLALCGVLLIGAASGCSTTQEKAERQQARAKHILDARAERQKEKKR
jgi:outer membrane lipoprotein-sorting protein